MYQNNRSSTPNNLRQIAPLLIVLLALLLRLTYIVTTRAWANNSASSTAVCGNTNLPAMTTPPFAGCATQFENVDARGYHWLAVNLLTQRTFSMNTEPPFRSDDVRAPLYPLFLAALYAVAGPDPRIVALAQAVLDCVTVAVTFRLGQRVARYRAGLLAALLYAFHPASWRFSNEVLTEILFGLLLTASLWMFARYILSGRNRDALWCGLLAGASILCKPNVQFLPLVLLGILIHGLYTGRRAWWQGAVIVTVTIGLMLLPWMARNRLVFGRWFYTMTFEDNLAHVSAVATLAHARGESVAPWTPRWEAIYDEVIAQAAARFHWQTLDQAQLSTRERDVRLQEITAVASDIVRAYPVDFITAHTRAWIWSLLPQEHRFWYERLSGQRWDELPALRGDALGRALAEVREGQLLAAAGTLVRERLLGLPPLALGLWLLWGLGYLASFVLFMWGALRLRPRVLALVLVATVFYVTFLPGPISQIRFRLPVVPAIIVLFVVGMGGVRDLLVNRTFARRAGRLDRAALTRPE